MKKIAIAISQWKSRETIPYPSDVSRMYMTTPSSADPSAPPAKEMRTDVGLFKSRKP